MMELPASVRAVRKAALGLFRVQVTSHSPVTSALSSMDRRAMSEYWAERFRDQATSSAVISRPWLYWPFWKWTP